jgi:hypothetical protein
MVMNVNSGITLNTSKSGARLVETLTYMDVRYKNDIARDAQQGLTALQKYIPQHALSYPF